MKKHNLIVVLFFLILSCKDSVVNVIPTKTKPAEINTGPVEESFDVILTKKTTLIKRVVFFSEKQLVEGVTEIRLEYINPQSEPMVLFFFKVDLNNKNLMLKPLTPNGGTAFSMQTIPDMMKVNKFSGYKVVGGVNSDFYDMSTGEPRSILFLNRVPIRTTLPTIRSYFAITDGGTPIIGDHTVFSTQRSTILDAVGGYHRLVKQHFPVQQTDISVHPRTAVGFTANRTVYFLVADGRNASYANGLTLAQVAQIMVALETKEAINLDGGGSSTFVVDDGQLVVRNKPSDGSPRKVANGWAIYTKTSTN